MKVLFLTFDGGGNLPPVLGVVAALVADGAEVTVLTEPCLAETVAKTGARPLALHGPVARETRDEPLLMDWQHRFPPAALKDTLDRVVFGPLKTLTAQTCAAIDAVQPDVVMTDWLMPAGIIAGEARGLPVAVLMHCTDMRPARGRPAAGCAPARGPLGRLRDGMLGRAMNGLANGFRRQINDVRMDHGLDPVPTAFGLYDRADRVLVQTSAAFDFPADPPLANTICTGPILDDPDWIDAGSTSARQRLILASLSSTYQNQSAALQAILTGLGRVVAGQGDRLRALVTRGPAMADQTFDVPPGVSLRDAVSHARMLPQTSVFISHCGHGSVMRALAHGVPVVCLPMGRDQNDVAVRVVHHGAGVMARKNAGSVARAVRKVLADPSYARASAAIGRQIREGAGTDRALREITALARSPRAELRQFG